MKILQINAVYGLGSTGTIVRDLQNICIDNGIECSVVYSQCDVHPVYGYKMGNLLSNKLHALLSRISGKQGYFSFFSTYNLLRYISKYQPDAIHIHNLHGCFINLPMLLKFAAKNNIAVIATLHDCWFYTGGCPHYTNAHCYKWLKQCGNCPLRGHEFPAFIWDGSKKILSERKSLFGAIMNLTAVGVSNWIIEEAKKTVFHNAKCISIRNGIDTVFFSYTESDFRKKYNLEGTKLILAPANKWFIDVNREALEYFASHLTDDMRMVFIGKGCDDRQLNDKMINIGFVSSREQIRELYSTADIMVNCTREESLSLLNVEVQSCGTPVITYSNTGVKETVDGKCGFAVENGNHVAMWSAMICVLKNGKSYYSQDCVKWVKQEFDKDLNYKKYIELYKSFGI